jgi:hypothetical protein
MNAVDEASKNVLLYFVKNMSREQADMLISRLPEWISLLEARDPLCPLEQVGRTG